MSQLIHTTLIPIHPHPHSLITLTPTLTHHIHLLDNKIEGDMGGIEPKEGSGFTEEK
jgi:hypothetical protein